MRRALIAVALLAACGNAQDGSAAMACEHFHNIAQDMVDGVLTDDELRDKFAQVRDVARDSDDQDVAEAAKGMLAAATQGADLNPPVRAMSSACDPYRS